MNIIDEIEFNYRNLKLKILGKIQQRWFKNPRCYVCKKRHARMPGWANIERPMCPACQLEQAALADEILKELEAEGWMEYKQPSKTLDNAQ